MKILGIESSCDETGAAIVENGTKILSNIIASSEAIHSKSGGIIPEIAAREQVKCILPVIQKAGACEFDAIAVTVGPGLVGSLLVGTETAKTLSYALNKPLVPVNHLTAHIYANWISETIPQLPAVVLIASGGHTDLLLMKSHEQIKYLGGTRDDAAGECFDKTARLINLPYPGGPAISKEAEKGDGARFLLPKPMINSNDFDFSFSGLKTAVLTIVKKLSKEDLEIQKADLAAGIQEVIIDVLVAKTLKAAKETGVKSIIIGGGVSANKRLRELFKKTNYFIYFPSLNLCGDNGAQTASAAYFHYKTKDWKEVQVNPSLSIVDIF